MTIKGFRGYARHERSLERVVREEKAPTPKIGNALIFYENIYGKYETRKMLADGRLVWHSKGCYVEVEKVDQQEFKKRAISYGKKRQAP